MDIIRYVRAIGGLLSIVSLLTVLVAHAIIPGVQVGPFTVLTLLSLVASLLGLDVAYEELPKLEVSLVSPENGSGSQNNGDTQANTESGGGGDDGGD
jgi:hypothetical protein